MSYRLKLLFAAGLIFTSACSVSELDNPNHLFRTHTVNGISVAETTGGPLYQADLFHFEYLLTLHENVTDESYLFGKHQLPYVDHQGQFIIALHTNDEARIAVFDSTGEYRYSFGRKGSGPGEFEKPWISSVENGIIAVFDSRLVRLSRFTTEGDLIDTHRLPYSVSPLSVREAHWGAADQILTINSINNSIVSDGSFQRQYFQTIVTAYTLTGDTAWTQETELVKGGRMLSVGRRTWFAQLPFNPRPKARYHYLQGVLLTTGREPILDLFTLEGTHRLKIQLNLTVEPVTDHDRSERRNWWQERLRNAPVNRKENVRESIANLEFPDNKAYWGEIDNNGIQIDESGFFWIRIPVWSTDGGDRAEGITYRVLSPTGEYLGNTTHPKPRGIDAQITRGHLIMFGRNTQTHESSVDVYRIQPAIEGFIYP